MCAIGKELEQLVSYLMYLEEGGGNNVLSLSF